MKVAVVVPDLIFFSRIEAAAQASRTSVIRVDSPADVPADAELVLVDWSARQPQWVDALRALTRASVVLFGPHTDVEAHAAARKAGLGPMVARSKLLLGLRERLGRS